MAAWGSARLAGSVMNTSQRATAAAMAGPGSMPSKEGCGAGGAGPAAPPTPVTVWAQKRAANRTWWDWATRAKASSASGEAWA